jgi:hypothetical protein
MPQIVGIASAVTPAEGEDYLLEDGEAPALTEAGWVRMGRAHAAGREAVIDSNLQRASRELQCSGALRP